MAGYTFDRYTRNRFAGRWAGRYLRFVKKSSSVRFASTDPNTVLLDSHPCIAAVWHGQFLLLAPLSPKGVKVAGMVARHGDAELIGEALKTFGMELVRGGGAAGRRKDRGGAQAFRGALRLLADGTSIVMTADVPPGPARKAGLGIVKLAALSGRPIVPLAAASSRYRTLDTWSRMTINLPFSKIGYANGDPIWVAANAGPAELEAARQAVEAGLNAATERAYTAAGRNAADVIPYAALSPGDPPARSSLSLKLYRIATQALTPTLPWLLKHREKQKKEDPARRGERLGRASIERPAGSLIWLHAASVGETNAILPLLTKLRDTHPDRRCLLTTGTVTSAALAEARLHPNDIHQYAPLDAPACMTRFLDHWRPDLAVLTESEIWPNTILACHARNIPIALINARMSDRSYKRWRKTRFTARPLFSRLRLILAQNERLARRFRELGGRDVRITGNLKLDAPPLPVDTTSLGRLKAQLESRPVFLAASTHPGEDEIAIDAYNRAKQTVPGLLLIIVPRHPERGAALMDLTSKNGLIAARRQAGDAITSNIDVYIADTMGELGLFYTLASAAFIGGSLVERGGQNPIEALRLSCGVICGPSQYNFLDIYRELRRHHGLIDVDDAGQLAAAIEGLLGSDGEHQHLIDNGQAALAALTGGLDKTAETLDALLRAPSSCTTPTDMRFTRAS